MADLDFFRRLMRYEDKELYQNIYENKYTCKVPYSSTLNAYDRNVTVTPVMSLKQYEGYGFQGDNNNPMEGSYKDDEFSEILEGVFGGNEFDADEVVEEYFDTFEVNLEENNYALNRQVNARRTIFEMAELYEDGNFVYLVYPNELKEVYGILEKFISIRLYKLNPRNSNNTALEHEIEILDKLATSIVEVYKENDDDLFYNTGVIDNQYSHLVKNKTSDVTKTILRTGSKVIPKVSLTRLSELGLRGN